MKASTGLCASLCGSLLLGCSSFPSLSGLFGGSVPTPVLRASKNADAEYQRGKQLHLAGQYGEAQQAYLAALAIDPDHAAARNGIAALIGANGDLDRAIAILADLSQRDPASHVYANLGYAYQLKGQPLDARDAYQRAVDLDPDNDRARERLLALDRKLLEAQTPNAVIEGKVPESSLVTQAALQSVGPSMYALRYPNEYPTAIAIPEPKVDLPTPIPVSGGATHRHSLPIELVNANGITGLARQLRSLLPNDEWRVVRTRNHAHFKLGATRIEYVPMYRSDAEHFATEIGIGVRFRANPDLQGPRLRIILGNDCKNFEQLQRRLASDRKLLAVS